MELPFDLAVSLLGLYPKNPETPIPKNLCTPMFTAAQFTIAKCWKQSFIISLTGLQDHKFLEGRDSVLFSFAFLFPGTQWALTYILNECIISSVSAKCEIFLMFDLENSLFSLLYNIMNPSENNVFFFINSIIFSC